MRTFFTKISLIFLLIFWGFPTSVWSQYESEELSVESIGADFQVNNLENFRELLNQRLSISSQSLDPRYYYQGFDVYLYFSSRGSIYKIKHTNPSSGDRYNPAITEFKKALVIFLGRSRFDINNFSESPARLVFKFDRSFLGYLKVGSIHQVVVPPTAASASFMTEVERNKFGLGNGPIDQSQESAGKVSASDLNDAQKKCLRLGLIIGSHDYKLCIESITK